MLQQRIDRLGRLSFLQLFSLLGAMLSCELVILFTSSTSFIAVRSPYSRVADSEWLSLLTYDNQRDQYFELKKKVRRVYDGGIGPPPFFLNI